MRELKYYVAITVDGFIAAEDGSYDAFLNEGEHLADMFNEYPETLPAHMREAAGVAGRANRVFDTVLMGRATYEVGARVGLMSPYPQMKQYVFSRTMQNSPHPDVELVKGDELALVRRLKQGEGKHLWLCGGGILATALYPEIDELVLKVNPTLLGRGIPLFAGPVAPARLSLVGTRTYANGYAVMRYRRAPGSR